MAAQIEYKFFEAVEKSFDKAAKFTNWDPGILGTDKAMQFCLSNVLPG